MDEHRDASTARNVAGKVQEGFGRVAGTAKTEIEGKMNQVAGAAEDLYGQAKDSAQEAVKVVKKQASEMDETSYAKPSRKVLTLPCSWRCVSDGLSGT